MSRFAPHIALLLLFGLLLAGAWFLAPRGGSAVRTSELAGSVWCLSKRGGNVAASVGADGVLMVDAKYRHFASELEEALAELADAGPAYLIDTHWHADHVGGNARFAPGAVIVAHANVRRRLIEDPTIEGRLEPPMEPLGLPVVTIEGESTVHFNGEEIRLIHVPAAHTDGDTVVWFTGSGVVHVGDLFLLGYPPVDAGSGGSVAGVIDGVRRLLEILPEDVVVLPGHGAPTDLETLRAYLAMAETVTERVRGHVARELQVDEILAADVLLGFEERWGDRTHISARRFVETLVEELGGGSE